MAFVYAIFCTVHGCPRSAEYKIAARWSDGLTEELKTYGLTCTSHLPEVFYRSLEKQKECCTAQGEVLEPPGIYRLEHGCLDGELQRLPELEQKLREGREQGRQGDKETRRQGEF